MGFSKGDPRDVAVWYLIYGRLDQYLRTFLVGCSLSEPFLKLLLETLTLVFSSPLLNGVYVDVNK